LFIHFPACYKLYAYCYNFYIFELSALHFGHKSILETKDKLSNFKSEVVEFSPIKAAQYPLNQPKGIFFGIFRKHIL